MVIKDWELDLLLLPIGTKLRATALVFVLRDIAVYY
jgi:hypothetical protein